MIPSVYTTVAQGAVAHEIGAGPVKAGRDLKRVLALPRRSAEELGTQIAGPLSEMLRADGGTRTLRPLQAVALAEAADLGGAVVLLPVGAGKTDVSFLLPTLLGAQRPLLLVPGKLLEKTRREFTALAAHWKLPAGLAVYSYEKLSTTPQLLTTIHPDLIIADEAHKLKSRTAGCTKRVARYLQSEAGQQTRFVALSGTLTKRSFMDWWHLALWALPEELLPLPGHYKEAEKWAEALDEKPPRRRALGALTAFGRNLQEARTGYGEMLRQVPGIAAARTAELGVSLRIHTQRHFIDAIDEAVERLESTWTTPAGIEFCEAVDLWSYSIQASQGFIYEWTEQPPAAWLDIRRATNSFVREKLARSRSLETPAQVLEQYAGERIVQQWRQVRNTFQPVTVPRWFDDALVQRALYWARENDGLIWCISTAFGKALQAHGVPFFCADGMTDQGLHIYDHAGCAAVSVAAMSEGFNLQRWRQNLVPCAPTTGTVWEQLLGRTHRPGQEADEVSCEVWWTTAWAHKNFETALNDAKYIESITGQRQKLCYADHTGE